MAKWISHQVVQHNPDTTDRDIKSLSYYFYIFSVRAMIKLLGFSCQQCAMSGSKRHSACHIIFGERSNCVCIIKIEREVSQLLISSPRTTTPSKEIVLRQLILQQPSLWHHDIRKKTAIRRGGKSLRTHMLIIYYRVVTRRNIGDKVFPRPLLLAAPRLH